MGYIFKFGSKIGCCIVAVLLLFGVGAVGARNANNYFFEQLSLREGLTQSTVKTVFRDHIGLLWIGTKDGLNRYDGSNVRTYVHDSTNEASLPNTNINFIVEDKNKVLWIGTAGALCTYNRTTDTFTKVKMKGRVLSFQNGLVAGDMIYFVTSTSLYTYNSTANTWSEKPFTGHKGGISLNCNLEPWGNGLLLIASRWSGLFVCNPATGELSKSSFFAGTAILDTYTDSKNQLWLSQNGAGVFCFNAKGEKIHEITPANSNMPCDKVMSIAAYGNELWMATDGDGIIVFTPATNSFELLTHNQNSPFSLPVNSFLTIYTDQYANLWLGTIRAGLIGVRKVNIRSYKHANLYSAYGLSEKTVLSFYEDWQGLIWIGTDGEGVNSFDPKTQRFVHYSATLGKKVTGIARYSEHELLLSFYKEGLALFNKKNGQLRPFLYKQKYNSERALWNGLLGINMLNAADGSIFLSEESIFKYNFNTQELIQIELPRKLEGVVRMNLNPTNPTELLVYSATAIRSLHTTTNALKTLGEITNADMGIINSVDVDNQGRIWVGMSSGLYLLDRTKFKPLFSNQLKSIATLISDSKGNLWIGSGLDLYCYTKNTGELLKYGKAEGVFANEYLPKSKLHSATGDIYLGGVEGFVHINKAISTKKPFEPVFELLNIQLNGTAYPAIKKDAKTGISTISIPYNHNSLVVNYFINTPNLSESKHCRYSLQGLNTAYSDAPSQSINLQSLAPGEYTLQLSYELRHNTWSTNFDLVHIHVMPPWWQTWWFYSLLFLMVVAALAGFKWFTERNAKQAMVLEMQFKEKELYEQKVKFLINISHELRTPLTLVYSPLSRLLKDSKNISDDVRHTLILMFKHLTNIRGIINMVLDVRKMDVTHNALQLETNDVNSWLRSLVNDFSLEFEARGIQLHFELDEEVTQLYFDTEKCEKIVSNLLMNALKFSEANSTISIKTVLTDGMVRFAIVDQGSGISANEVHELFTRFYQGSHNKGGSGIGLSFCKTLVEMHGGQIGYLPGPANKGSEFWFTIPCHIQHVQAEYVAPATPIAPETAIFTANAASTSNIDLQNITVLLVEDEKELLNYLKESLGGYFKKIITATDGEKGYTQLINYMPDIVISDVMMPKMNGFELCKKIKSTLDISHIPVVLLTALGADEHVLTGYKHGADMYLSKPFDVEQLVAIVANLHKSRQDIKSRYKELNNQLLPEQLTFSNADEQFLSKLIANIELKIEDNEIDINELAQEMALGRTSFYTKVKAITGMSANAFIVDYKIKKAITMLTHSDLPVVEIASLLGFSNQRYFSTVFKQYTGKTPTQYRNETTH